MLLFWIENILKTRSHKSITEQMSLHNSITWLEAERSRSFHVVEQTAHDKQIFSTIEAMDMDEGWEPSPCILYCTLEFGENVLLLTDVSRCMPKDLLITIICIYPWSQIWLNEKLHQQKNRSFYYGANKRILIYLLCIYFMDQQILMIMFLNITVEDLFPDYVLKFLHS